MSSARRLMRAAGGSGSFSNVVVFYSPHQDDESLFMGLAIANAVVAGLEVHVVILTTGQNSAARLVLTGSAGSCPWHSVTHAFSMTELQFSGYRDVEQSEAVQAIGVPAANWHIAGPRPEDGALTATFARSVINDYEALYPGALHRTMSWRDSHADHIALGVGLRDAYDAGEIGRALWSIRSELYDTWDGTPETDGAAAAAAAVAGCQEYKVYSPGDDRYGCGYHSVPTLLDEQIAGPFGKSHEAYQNR